MTITQDASAPLVVICGSTGVQGGSVIKALSESDKPYRLRGLTRDITKPKAVELESMGVQMVNVSLTVDNEPNILKAFEDANISFVCHYSIFLSSCAALDTDIKVVTNFWEHMIKQRVACATLLSRWWLLIF